MTLTSRQRVYQAIQSLAQERAVVIEDTSPLIGDGSLFDSMQLVELCLLLEDISGELGFSFDWTSETAMSRSRSMFRTAGTLASEFEAQQGAAR